MLLHLSDQTDAGMLRDLQHLPPPPSLQSFLFHFSVLLPSPPLCSITFSFLVFLSLVFLSFETSNEIASLHPMLPAPTCLFPTLHVAQTTQRFNCILPLTAADLHVQFVPWMRVTVARTPLFMGLSLLRSAAAKPMCCKANDSTCPQNPGHHI